MTPERAPEALIALAGILVSEQNVEGTLRQILELACEALSGGDEGGITLLEADGPATAIATSDAALRVDRSQYDAATVLTFVPADRTRRLARGGRPGVRSTRLEGPVGGGGWHGLAPEAFGQPLGDRDGGGARRDDAPLRIDGA